MRAWGKSLFCIKTEQDRAWSQACPPQLELPLEPQGLISAPLRLVVSKVYVLRPRQMEPLKPLWNHDKSERKKEMSRRKGKNAKSKKLGGAGWFILQKPENRRAQLALVWGHSLSLSECDAVRQRASRNTLLWNPTGHVFPRCLFLS